MLPDEAVKEFQDLYKQTFKKDLSFDMARERANKIFQLFKIIARPINLSKEEYKYELSANSQNNN